MKITTAIILASFVIFFQYYLSGWVFSILWDWFIVPTFGLTSLSVVQSIGIILVLRYLIRKENLNEKINNVDSLLNDFIHPLLFLVIGKIVVTFI